MNRRFAGIDIGSRTIEVVVVDESGSVVENVQADTGFDPMAVALKLTKDLRYDAILATGYGRNLFEINFDSATVTEIKAHATGAVSLHGSATTVIDIGGQDSKVIALSEAGKVKKFEMNDRCAAGTGKFLEIMAKALGYEIGAFGDEALKAERGVDISSMCTVFAESEVTSLIAQGRDRREIALGVHTSVVRRVTGMVKRVSSDGDVVFTGGVARNPCVLRLIRESLPHAIVVPEDPQMVGALGAALLVQREATASA